MYDSLLERTSSGVTVQALAVVVGLVEPDFFGFGRRPQVVDVHVTEAAELCFESAEHGVIRVAGVAGLVRWDAMILEMRSGEMAWIVNSEAPAVRLHDVTREAESRALRVVHL